MTPQKRAQAQTAGKTKMDDRDKAVMDAILSEGGKFTHVAMWYLQGVKDHEMLRISRATGKPDRRDNITRLSDRLHRIIYDGSDLSD